MIKIRSDGNTTIRVSTKGTDRGTEWAVYPNLDTDPTLQSLTPEQREKERELRFRGIRKGGEDPSGTGMQDEIADAIASLLKNTERDRFQDLGIVVHQIDIDSEGRVAGRLDEKYGIRPVETEGQTPPEVK